MDEIQAFIHSLKYYSLTSQQRKTLRGQALAGNLPAARAGLRKIVSRGVQHGHSNAVGR
ncbi:MAG: hypothetical protein ABFC56_05070 [Clostridiaceae bacterium]